MIVTDEPRIFTADELSYVTRYTEYLRGMVEGEIGDQDREAKEFHQRITENGRFTKSKVIEFCDDLDAYVDEVLASPVEHDGVTFYPDLAASGRQGAIAFADPDREARRDKVRANSLKYLHPFEANARSVTFADVFDDPSITQGNEDHMSDTLQRSQREIDRAENVAWLTDRQGSTSSQAGSGSAPADRAMPMGSSATIPPTLFLDDPDVLDQARLALDGDIREAASRASAMHPTEIAGNYTTWSSVAESNRYRLLLSRLADGKPLDMQQIEAEVAWKVLCQFLKTKGSAALGELASAVAGHEIRQRRQLTEIDGQVEFERNRLRNGARLDGFALSVGPILALRRGLVAKGESVAAARKALTPAIAASVRKAFDEAGGVEKIAMGLREARMITGAWPEKDYRLDELKSQLDEASARMLKFRSADPDLPEGPLAVAARVDRDRILPLVEARRLEVEQAALAKINLLIGSAIEGQPAPVAELTQTVSATPAAFPPDFLTALGSIPYAAVLESGSLGFLYALT